MKRMRAPSSTFALVVIVLAQFAGTSLWFAGNAVLPDLQAEYGFGEAALGHITSSVQFGFIVGTLVFAALTIADRFSPSKVFFASATFGALCNAGILMVDVTPESVFVLRFLTGFCLAGIYPVGMKIAADYHEKGLGKALGFLLGALVLGTAFPHFLRSQAAVLEWEYVIWSVSGLAALGGLVVYFLVPDGPFRSRGAGLDLTAVFKLFRIRDFRAAALGYFGHMWELYAFWAFVPVLLGYGFAGAGSQGTISMWSFLIIGAGALSCIAGGYLSEQSGSAKVAFIALAVSAVCCLVSPIILLSGVPSLLLVFLLVWGLAVIADSPQFSTLVAGAAPGELRGSGLTIVNCIGFSITIVSIQLLNLLAAEMSASWLFLLLAPGPVLGLVALARHSGLQKEG